jgi:hypothetical protein
VREAYLVEEFRYCAEANGHVVERSVREPVLHRVVSPTNLIERTRRFFELQMSNAESRSALQFDGLRIVRVSDAQVVFKATVGDQWDAMHKPPQADLQP